MTRQRFNHESRPSSSPASAGAAGTDGPAGGAVGAPPALSQKMEILAVCIALHDGVPRDQLFAELLRRRAGEIGIDALFAECAGGAS